MPVYVLNDNGQPLMPTKRFGKVRRLLKERKAEVVNRCPFTIRLNYHAEENVQPVALGIDAGSKIIGVSAGNLEQAVAAEKAGADYIGVGAVFTTSTKLDHTRITFETLKEITSAVSIPVVAIGGISADNLEQLNGTGINGISVISAIFGQPDPGRATQELLRRTKEMLS